MAVALRSNGCRICLLAALATLDVHASESMPAQLYEVTTETGMPHLEENLRYAVTRDKRCLAEQDLSSAFSILSHASLADCKLRQENRRDDTLSYVLDCTGGHGTIGSATWRIGEDVIRGMLNVKLGGKNMTFFQRVTATLVGECPVATPQ